MSLIAAFTENTGGTNRQVMTCFVGASFYFINGVEDMSTIQS